MSRMTLSCVFALAGLLGACVDLSEDLEGEPCTVEDDCWHTQDCARTQQEELYALPGVCAPKDTQCVHGRQLGCSCTPGDINSDCTIIALPPALYQFYPRMVCDPAFFQCVVAPQDGGSP
jgi:hypothetical protein